MRAIAAAAALALACPGGAAVASCPVSGDGFPAETADGAVTAKRLFRHVAAYHALDPEDRDSFEIVYQLLGVGGPAPEACAAVARGAGEPFAGLPLDGRARLAPPSPELMASEAIIVWRSADAEARIQAVFRPTGAPAASYEGRALRRAIAQGSALLRQVHGVKSLAAPGFGSVEFAWEGPAPLAEAVLEDGSRRALPVAYDRAWFTPARDRAMRRAVAVEFGRAPERAVLAP